MQAHDRVGRTRPSLQHVKGRGGTVVDFKNSVCVVVRGSGRWVVLGRVDLSTTHTEVDNARNRSTNG